MKYINQLSSSSNLEVSCSSLSAVQHYSAIVSLVTHMCVCVVHLDSLFLGAVRLGDGFGVINLLFSMISFFHHFSPYSMSCGIECRDSSHWNHKATGSGRS